ncbi:hypothetical protein K525DRAFT_362581 [Schizophyllum commune Loenen D]|nr:hypothetical protein K525DRAFT_362581 [Schizophyllum commune Loenen D]
MLDISRKAQTGAPRREEWLHEGVYGATSSETDKLPNFDLLMTAMGHEGPGRVHAGAEGLIHDSSSSLTPSHSSLLPTAMSLRATNTTKDTANRHVNEMLDALRGEHFRHTQNVSRVRRTPPPSINRAAPTLPFFLEYYAAAQPTAGPSTPPPGSGSGQPKRQSGPPPPRSWTRSSTNPDAERAPSLRYKCLPHVFAHLPGPSHAEGFPTLALVCLRALLAVYTPEEIVEDVAPLLPGHLRRLLVRDAAIHSPFSTAQLLELGGEEGHIEGELVVVGPSAGLREEHVTRLADSARAQATSEDWDADDDTGTPPLQTLVLMSARLTPTALLKLPPSITHLTLINLPEPILLHRLPGVCPLLIYLDLSHNTWLSKTERRADLTRIEWPRWTQLRRLALIGCYIPDELPMKVNKSRWDDVDIIST